MSKRKFQKDKDRQKRVRKKVLSRRAALRAYRQAEESRENAYDKEYNEGKKQMPIVNDPERKDELLKARLQENMKILQALEDEYDKEIKDREDRNRELDNQGAKTLKEKLDKLAASDLSQKDKENLEKMLEGLE